MSGDLDIVTSTRPPGHLSAVHPPREFMLARMAARIEVDAPLEVDAPPAYLANAELGSLRYRGDSGA